MQCDELPVGIGIIFQMLVDMGLRLARLAHLRIACPVLGLYVQNAEAMRLTMMGIVPPLGIGLSGRFGYDGISYGKFTVSQGLVQYGYRHSPNGH